MKTRMEQTPENLNPVFSISKDGTILYSNGASEPILHEWCGRVGDKLPLSIGDLVQRVLSRNNPEKIEVKVGNKLYLVVFSPLPEQECVNISGFDISDQEELEKKVLESEAQKGTERDTLLEELRKSEKLVIDRTRELEEANRQKIDVLESILDCFYALDKDLRFTYVNKAAEEIWGLSRADLIGRKIEDVFAGLIDISLSKFYRALEEQTPQYYEVYSKVIQRWGDMNVYPSKDGIFVYFHDITERKRAEEALKESEFRYRTLFDSIDEAFCIIEMIFDENGKPIDYRFLETNPSFEKQTGLIDAVGKRMRELAPKHEEHWFEIYGRISLTGEPARFQNPAEQLHRYYDVYAFRFGQPEKKQVAILFNDITRNKLAEEAIKNANETLEDKIKERTSELEKSKQQINEILESISDAFYAVDSEWKLTYVNKRAEEWWKHSKDELLGTVLWDLFPNYEKTQGYWEHKRAMQERVPVTFETFSPNLLTWVEANIYPAADGGISVYFRDITERKKTEELMKKINLSHRQEIHHRIKNNLQVISSLLDLQAEKFRGKKDIKDSQILEAFKESQDRVISMTLIHEELHKGGKLDTLNFSKYIQELADNLFLSYRLGNEGPGLDMDIEENIFFDMDTSVPLGIIINELVSNSLKHAFPCSDKGEIRIKLHREENGKCEIEDIKSTTFTLSVSDNGIGIPEDFDIEDVNSLGLQLVTTLVDQLDGEFELKRNKGTEFTIMFTVPEGNNPKLAKSLLQLTDND